MMQDTAHVEDSHHERGVLNESGALAYMARLTVADEQAKVTATNESSCIVGGALTVLRFPGGAKDSPRNTGTAGQTGK